jgi:putative polyhydroxyalkanoate system protein
MAQEYEISSAWQGDELHFNRSGVSGMLALYEKEALLEIKLGIFMKAFASTIEEKIAAKMKRIFAAAA